MPQRSMTRAKKNPQAIGRNVIAMSSVDEPGNSDPILCHKPEQITTKIEHWHSCCTQPSARVYAEVSTHLEWGARGVEARGVGAI